MRGDDSRFVRHREKVELLNRVRSSKVQRIRELPMVIISGEDEAGERDRAASLGATDFIQKGVGAAELLARMEVLVRLSTTREMLAESQATLVDQIRRQHER